MTYEWPLYFTLFLALWSAVVGGTFSAFSEFVMSGLLRATPAGGIESMQHINKTVIKTSFVAGIFLISIFSVIFALYGLMHFEGQARAMIILAAIVYVPSVFLMTIFGNVPMNERLAAMDHTSAEAGIYWIEYGKVWTQLNHIRTLGAIVTSGLYLVGAVSLISS